jgi:hypothetical protein
MEEMGKIIKEKYMCPLSSIERSKSPGSHKNNYWLSSGLYTKSDRSNTRFYSSYWLSGRPIVIANRYLVSYTVNPKTGVERVSNSGCGTNIGYASQLSNCNCNYCNLGYSYSRFYVFAMAINKKYLTSSSSRPAGLLTFNTRKEASLTNLKRETNGKDSI